MPETGSARSLARSRDEDVDDLAVVDVDGTDRRLGSSEERRRPTRRQAHLCHQRAGIYAINMKEGIEGKMLRYPRPEELWNLTFAAPNPRRDRFAAIPFEDRGGTFSGRYYQA